MEDIMFTKTRPLYPGEGANSVILWDKPIVKPEKRTYFCHDIPPGREEKPKWNYPEDAPVVRYTRSHTLIPMKKRDDDATTESTSPNGVSQQLCEQNSGRKSARPSSARAESSRQQKSSQKLTARPLSATGRPPKLASGNRDKEHRPVSGSWTTDTFLRNETGNSKDSYKGSSRVSDVDTGRSSSWGKSHRPPRPHSTTVPSLALQNTQKHRPMTTASSDLCEFSPSRSTRPSTGGSSRHRDHIQKSKFINVKSVADRTEPFRPTGIAEKDSMVLPITKTKPLARVGGGYIDTRTGIAAGGNNVSHAKALPGRTKNTARLHSSIDQLIQDLSMCTNGLERQAIKIEFTKSVRRFAKSKPVKTGKY